MSESLQAVTALLMIVGMIGSVMVFFTDKIHWGWLVGMPALAVGSLAVLLASLLRRDKVPDFLKRIPGPLMERDGFCFKIAIHPTKGRCYVELHFQTRYSNPSRAVVVLQPSKGFFLNRPNVASVVLEMECPAGGYGVTAVPWPVPRKFQGRVFRLDVGADVSYPEGKGTMIRYRGGLQVRTAGRDTFRTVVTVAGAMTGTIVLSHPAGIKVRLPKDVEETVDDDLPISTKILWTLGDPYDPNVFGKLKKAVDPDL